MKTILGLALLLAHTPTMAAGVYSRAEESLRQFVERNPQLRARFHALAREEALASQNRDSDLRDALSDTSRAGLLKIMPGFKIISPSTCRTLADCAFPDLAMDVGEAELLPNAVRNLVRPWMLLQRARRARLILTPMVASGDGLLRLKLRGLDAAPLTLNLALRPQGGFKLWFDKPLLLAELYGRERGAALRAEGPIHGAVSGVH